VQKVFFLGPLLLLAACNRGTPTKDAIRQGVLDHLAGSSLNLAAMEMDVTSVQANGNNADVTVTFWPKGATAAQGMALHYRMQEKGSRWSVVGIQDSGHAGATPPGVSNPHGAGGMPSGNPHGIDNPRATRMPSPDDLPPTGQK
jgi:hypothetical protein